MALAAGPTYGLAAGSPLQRRDPVGLVPTRRGPAANTSPSIDGSTRPAAAMHAGLQQGRASTSRWLNSKLVSPFHRFMAAPEMPAASPPSSGDRSPARHP